MTKTTRFMFGMGTGLAVGIGAAVGIKAMGKKKKGGKLVQTANKAVHAVGDIMENIQDMIG